MPYYVKDVMQAIDDLCGGRCVKDAGDWSMGKNPFVVTKSSNIPGKAVTEMPGLIWGNPQQEVKKIAVMMTLTESAIELAAATGVNVVVAHHPIADAANSGGVLLKTYLDLYGIAAFELHEAFHGLHPGIPFLHGHKPFFATVAYDGIHGCVVYVGDALPEVKTIGDMTARLDKFMNVETDELMLEAERKIRGCGEIAETSVAARCKILVGEPDRPVNKVIHMFPHTGFTAKHLEALVKDNPDVDTLIATISRVYPGHELIEKAHALGLSFVCGNSHAVEVFENGLPMAYAIRNLLPGAEVVLFRERMTSVPLDVFGSDYIRNYARDIADKYLTKKQ